MTKVFEWFRIITPVLVTIVLFMITSIKTDVAKIDDKLFKHLTNDELHIPRNLVVSQEAFTLYQVMRNKQVEDIADRIKEVKEILLKK